MKKTKGETVNGGTTKVVILLQCLINGINYIKVYKGATIKPSGDSRVRWQLGYCQDLLTF